VSALRAPGGCPWDAQQTHRSIARNMVEEAYEALDAIESGSPEELQEELGDVALQVVFQARIAQDEGEFTIDDVLDGIADKLIRRHPHVFGVEAAFAAAHLSAEQIEQIGSVATPKAVLDLWDQIKLAEKAAANAADVAPRAVGDAAGHGLLDGVPTALPALMQAQDISRKAVAAGFEWSSDAEVFEQLTSELEEFAAERQGSEAAAEEFGDILFVLVNMARRWGIDAESALRSSCLKFRERWRLMEGFAHDKGRAIDSFSAAEQEQFWQLAKEAKRLSLEQ
jgi:tetrapyrrole methylase family protein/MazG family protein